jgi:hypothetical protein
MMQYESVWVSAHLHLAVLEMVYRCLRSVSGKSSEQLFDEHWVKEDKHVEATITSDSRLYRLEKSKYNMS